MADFLESLAEQVQNRWCALSTDDIVLGGLLAAGSGAGLPALGIAGVIGVARKSSDQICNKSAPTPDYVSPSPSFSGGQCDGQFYRGQSIGLKIAGFPQDTSPRVVGSCSSPFVGAIQSFTFGEITGGIGFTVVHAGGTFTQFVSSAPLSDVEIFPSLEVLPCSGTDDCGDPPSPSPDPLSEYDDVIDDVPFEDENGDPINFPDLPVKWFPPCVTLEGIKIPFEVTTPLGKICGQVIAKPDIKTGIKPKVDFDLCPSERQILEPAVPEKIKDYFELSDDIGDVESPFPPSDYGSTPALQADNEKPILGVFIECGTDGSDNGKATKIFNNDDDSDAPTLFVPRIGYVRFWMLAEREEADAVQWSLPIDIKQPRAFIPCPSPFGALAVDVQMLDGYSAKYKVAKRKTCCEACEKFDPNAPNDALDRCD